MGKLCLIYNTAPHYRSAIFKAIDKQYDCDWYFGPTLSDIKEMDTSILKNVSYYKTIGNPSKLYYKFGILKLLFKNKYNTFFALAEVRSVTDWIFFYLANKLFPKKKVYIWTHGWYGKEKGIQAKLKLWLYKHVAGIFIYANYAKELLVKEGIPAEKLFVIHNSLDYEKQISLRNKVTSSTIYSSHFGNNHPVLIFIGRLTPVKQLDMLVEAVAKMNAKGNDCNLVFVGNGSEKNKLEEKVKEYGLENQVWFYGACYDDSKNAELIHNADLCVAPGNVGLTAIHTMVFGTPVISHDDFKWQMPEFEAIKPDETGDFFKKGDVDSLVDVITWWLKNNSTKRDVVRQNCQNEIDKYWNPSFQMDVIKQNLKVE